MKSKTAAAKLSNLPEIMNLINEFLLNTSYSETVKNQILISAEEIFTNIVSYAYPDQENGMVEVSCGITERNGSSFLQIGFRDWGIPYNPLKRKDPDFEIPFEERKIGGLGIYMVRQFMDSVEYQFADGCNQLWLGKLL